MDNETKQVLAQAMYKVRELRRRNEILEAQVHTMDTLAAFLFAQAPQRGMASEEDIAWRIEKLLANADKKID
jgi:cell division protein FtsB